MIAASRILLLAAALFVCCQQTIRAAEEWHTEKNLRAIERDPSVVYSEEENFRYIDEVLAKLNNNEECILPSWDEVDELQRSFAQLEEALGGADQLQAKLSPDQKLVQDTLLDQWTFFQQRMTAGVVIKSSKKRAFLGKVEKYQERKYGSSVCTRFVDDREVTEQIFIKNPIVRYVHFIETGRKVVPDFPDNPEPAPRIDLPEPELEPELEKEGEAEPEAELEAEPESDDKYKVLVVPIPDGPLNLTIEYIPLDENHDPLTDIPAPPMDDPEPEPEPEPQPEPEPEPEPQPEPEPEPEPAPEPEPVYDPNAPELVDPEADELDLQKLDKPEPKEWEFDYANGELKWPDEEPGAKCTEADDQVKKDWAQFLENPQLCVRADGSLYDCTKGRHNLKSKPGAEQRRRQFVQTVKIHMDEKQIEAMVGWHPDRWDPNVERRVRVPPGQREPPKVRREPEDEGWSRLYSGRFCRVSINRRNINDSRGVRAVKTLFGKDDYSKKKKMLRIQRSEL